jgi:hypothetical protein
LGATEDGRCSASLQPRLLLFWAPWLREWIVTRPASRDVSRIRRTPARPLPHGHGVVPTILVGFCGHFGGLQRFRPASWPISIARRGSIGYWLRDERNQAARITTISLAFPRYTVVCLLYAP